jgi:hypothetical protein
LILFLIGRILNYAKIDNRSDKYLLESYFI